jgi:hypothetical protein
VSRHKHLLAVRVTSDDLPPTVVDNPASSRYGRRETLSLTFLSLFKSDLRGFTSKKWRPNCFASIRTFRRRGILLHRDQTAKTLLAETYPGETADRSAYRSSAGARLRRPSALVLCRRRERPSLYRCVYAPRYEDSQNKPSETQVAGSFNLFELPANQPDTGSLT